MRGAARQAPSNMAIIHRNARRKQDTVTTATSKLRHGSTSPLLVTECRSYRGKSATISSPPAQAVSTRVFRIPSPSSFPQFAAARADDCPGITIFLPHSAYNIPNTSKHRTRSTNTQMSRKQKHTQKIEQRRLQWQLISPRSLPDMGSHGLSSSSSSPCPPRE